MSYNYLAAGLDRYLFEARADILMSIDNGQVYAKTTDVNGHYHFYAVDQDGNGNTLAEWQWPFDGIDSDDIAPNHHIHKVKNWIVLQTEAHIHEFDLRKAAQEKLGHKIIKDPMTIDDIDKDK